MVYEPSPTERLLKIAQVARMANLSERSVRRDIALGRLVVIRLSPRRLRVTLSEVKRYLRLA